jgi:hypothetical protein
MFERRRLSTPLLGKFAAGFDSGVAEAGENWLGFCVSRRTVR